LDAAAEGLEDETSPDWKEGSDEDCAAKDQTGTETGGGGGILVN
jgi:hypothetical protein